MSQGGRWSAPLAPAPWAAGAALALVAVLASAWAAQAATWTDATDEAGVTFREAGEIHIPAGEHEVPDLDWPAFPEIMGGGACWADVDNDGYEDAYLVNQVYNEANPQYGDWAEALDTRNRLFLNDGDGTFTDATDGSGADADAFGYGCSAADYDADGCLDLAVTNFGPAYLFRGRCDGTFTNATAALGRVGQEGACGDYACFGTSSGWADYDRDGDLDLYIANYVDSNLTDDLRGPNNHVGQHNFLLRNEGDGTFAEVGEAAGVTGNHSQGSDGSKSLGVGWLDYDLDGWPDLFVANDETDDYLFHNDGDGTFTEVGEAAGVDDPRAGMGITVGDYDNDGLPDLFFTHYQNEHNGFYRNLGDGTFEAWEADDDLANSLDRTGWGTRFVDHDRDGWLDLILANGHTEWIVDYYAQDIQVYRNEAEADPSGPGDRQWTDVTAASGDVDGARVHRGLAFADAELDGDVDMLSVPNANETAQLLRGEGVENRWLYLQLRQPGANRDALGARVELTVGGLTQTREHYPGQSYLSQNSMLLEFGLGSAATADTLRITWPSGEATVLHDLPADRVVRVVRGVAGYVTDTLAPQTRVAIAGPGQAGWFRGPVEATLSASDRAVGPASGVQRTEVSVDGGPWVPYAGPVTVADEGVHVLRARSADAAGNLEPPRRVELRVDLTPPAPAHELAGTAGQHGWHVAPVQVTLLSLDALSGPGAIRYRLGAGAWQDYAAPFVLGDGVHQLEFVAADAVGNEAAPAAFEVRVDTTPPALAAASPAPGALYLQGAAMLQLPAGAAAPAVVVTDGAAPFLVAALAADEGSGVPFVRFALDGALLGADDGAPYEALWRTSASAEGLHVLEVAASDAAGNAAVLEVRVVLVSTAPGSVGRTLAEGPSLELGSLGAALPLPLGLAMAAPLLARRRLRP